MSYHLFYYSNGIGALDYGIKVLCLGNIECV